MSILFEYVHVHKCLYNYKISIYILSASFIIVKILLFVGELQNEIAIHIVYLDM